RGGDASRRVEARAALRIEQGLAEGGVEVRHLLAQGLAALAVPAQAVLALRGLRETPRRGQQLVSGGGRLEARLVEEVAAHPQQLGVRLDRQPELPALVARLCVGDFEEVVGADGGGR